MAHHRPSTDATKTAWRPLSFLRKPGYAGRIYPVNPGRDEVLGERAFPSLDAVPDVPEHAYMVANAEASIAAIEQCGRIGVPVVTALARRFRGSRRRKAARAKSGCDEIVAHDQDPHHRASSLGVVDLRIKTVLTANAAFDEKICRSAASSRRRTPAA